MPRTICPHCGSRVMNPTDHLRAQAACPSRRGGTALDPTLRRHYPQIIRLRYR